MRRYIGLKIDELEELATDNASDAALAQAILDELKHRRWSARVEALANRCISITHASGRTNSVNDAGASVEEPDAYAPAREQEPEAAASDANAVDAVLPSDGLPTEAQQDSSPLARMRKRLLDLSAANRLLNFRHHSGTTVRVVDEVPGHVFERLVEDAKVMTFDPVVSDDFDEGEEDEPQLPFAAEEREPERRNRAESRQRKAREIARQNGINTSWDLVATQVEGNRRLGDSKLQTLLFPEDLEGVLRRIDQKARSAINETGANMLHLMFGFVEWLDVPREQADEESYRAAPLVLVPVALKKGDVDPRSGFRTYAVSSSGEAWDTNVTLVEKCRTELGTALPRKRDDEPLHGYFARIDAWLVSHSSGWRLRRWVSLGLVSFGKILMWRDLDPENWPAEEGLLEHPLVREFTSGEPGSCSLDAGGEYPLDELHAGGERVPDVVVEADSSQHSVLVDVAQGKNLVVQGPPGTGKSQTIVNLIADALASKRKVLFVAEKKAALDVVFKRLSDVGLGDFCLALHSHTSQKREFLEELGRRLEMRDRAWRPRRSLEELRTEIAAARDKLNAHVARLHKRVDPIGLSAFEIFGKAQRVADSLWA